MVVGVAEEFGGAVQAVGGVESLGAQGVVHQGLADALGEGTMSEEDVSGGEIPQQVQPLKVSVLLGIIGGCTGGVEDVAGPSVQEGLGCGDPREEVIGEGLEEGSAGVEHLEEADVGEGSKQALCDGQCGTAA